MGMGFSLPYISSPFTIFLSLGPLPFLALEMEEAQVRERW
jgi:hypothetical protein